MKYRSVSEYKQRERLYAMKRGPDFIEPHNSSLDFRIRIGLTQEQQIREMSAQNYLTNAQQQKVLIPQSIVLTPQKMKRVAQGQTLNTQESGNSSQNAKRSYQRHQACSQRKGQEGMFNSDNKENIFQKTFSRSQQKRVCLFQVNDVPKPQESQSISSQSDQLIIDQDASEKQNLQPEQSQMDQQPQQQAFQQQQIIKLARMQRARNYQFDFDYSLSTIPEENSNDFSCSKSKK